MKSKILLEINRIKAEESEKNKQKVIELAIGDNLMSLVNKMDGIRKQADKDFDRSFTEIRQFEKTVERLKGELDAEPTDKFKSFMNALYAVEKEFDEAQLYARMTRPST